jgi:hypothetical protein
MDSSDATYLLPYQDRYHTRQLINNRQGPDRRVSSGRQTVDLMVPPSIWYTAPVM